MAPAYPTRSRLEHPGRRPHPSARGGTVPRGSYCVVSQVLDRRFYTGTSEGRGSPSQERLSRFEGSPPQISLPGSIRAFPSAHPRNPSPRIAIRTAIQETRRRGCVPEAPASFRGRHLGNPGVREAILGAGKAIQPFGFVPEAPGALFFGPEALESRRGEFKSPGKEDQRAGRLVWAPDLLSGCHPSRRAFLDASYHPGTLQEWAV